MPPAVVDEIIRKLPLRVGLYVPDDRLFSARSAPALQQILGRPVQFENLGGIGPDFRFQYRFANEIKNLQADGVFFIVVPFDLKRLDDTPLWAQQRTHKGRPWFFDLSNLAYFGRSSRAFFVAQHFMLRDEDFAIRAFLMKGDPDDFAHVPETPVAEKRLERLGILVQRLSSELRDRGIPLYVIPMPSRLQAALIGRRTALPGVDPLAFPRRVAEIAHGAGAKCIDVIPEFEQTAHPERAFYAVDGHLNAFGNELLARAVVNYFDRNRPTNK